MERGISSTIRRSLSLWSSATPRRWSSGCAGSGGVALIRAGAWDETAIRQGAGQVDLPRTGNIGRGDTIDFYFRR